MHEVIETMIVVDENGETVRINKSDFNPTLHSIPTAKEEPKKEGKAPPADDEDDEEGDAGEEEEDEDDEEEAKKPRKRRGRAGA